MDPVSDMLVRIRNAQMAHKRVVVVSHSRLNLAVLGILKETGFVGDATRRGRRNRRLLEVALVYDAAGSGRIHGMQRVSKQSRRMYVGADDIVRSRRGSNGMFVISTSRGVMSSAAAKKAHVGGEIICEVW